LLLLQPPDFSNKVNLTISGLELRLHLVLVYNLRVNSNQQPKAAYSVVQGLKLNSKLLSHLNKQLALQFLDKMQDYSHNKHKQIYSIKILLRVSEFSRSQLWQLESRVQE
jgi:hypothetical protein